MQCGIITEMGASYTAKQAKISPAAKQVARESVENLQIADATEPIRQRDIRRNNTLRFTNPSAYVEGSARNAASRIQRSAQASGAREAASQIEMQKSINDARYRNTRSLEKIAFETSLFNLGASSIGEAFSPTDETIPAEDVPGLGDK